MGWTAALGSLGLYSAEAAYLFAVLYSWQMQHFMTIAWARRQGLRACASDLCAGSGRFVRVLWPVPTRRAGPQGHPAG